ncbi:MAG: AmmeMemoRadiSam system radical SAM enzyme [Proteobacteria bacterium]|nr:AmmeMemoRadiSam system radical SAM enzyme [Pseudomonadota bacterium]MBU1649556.1 AmmeMemoRadiSam system radical SAM enzyme [Pseudomonadota bacterium]
MHEAQLYSQGNDGEVICELCAHHCRIKDGHRGICGVRENRSGILVSLVYGYLVAEHVDPVEKKPLYHFLPGSGSYSISTVGCNFRCRHCQNFSISQPGKFAADAPPGILRSPEYVVAEAMRSGCQSISYTYVEPTIFFEFAYDCSVLAREQGLKNIFVSNGYMSEKTTRKLAPLLDAINIDIKAFTEDFYHKICGARLQPVLDTVRLMHELGVWVELTTLLIPGLNDSDAELTEIAEFIVSLDPSIPWHVTAFYPTYKMTDRPATSVHSLQKARKIGLAAGLRYVYEGNVPGSGGENSSCPSCQARLITRFGFIIEENRLVHGCCPQCGAQIAGVWR